MPSGNGEKKKTKVVSKEKHLAKNFQRLPNVKNFPFFSRINATPLVFFSGSRKLSRHVA
jgi:hypothetical protein